MYAQADSTRIRLLRDLDKIDRRWHSADTDRQRVNAAKAGILFLDAAYWRHGWAHGRPNCSERDRWDERLLIAQRRPLRRTAKMTNGQIKALATEEIKNLLAKAKADFAADADDFRAECTIGQLQSELSARAEPKILTVYKAEHCTTPLHPCVRAPAGVEDDVLIVEGERDVAAVYLFWRMK